MAVQRFPVNFLEPVKSLTGLKAFLWPGSGLGFGDLIYFISQWDFAVYNQPEQYGRALQRGCVHPEHQRDSWVLNQTHCCWRGEAVPGGVLEGLPRLSGILFPGEFPLPFLFLSGLNFSSFSLAS